MPRSLPTELHHMSHMIPYWGSSLEDFTNGPGRLAPVAHSSALESATLPLPQDSAYNAGPSTSGVAAIPRSELPPNDQDALPGTFATNATMDSASYIPGYPVFSNAWYSEPYTHRAAGGPHDFQRVSGASHVDPSAAPPFHLSNTSHAVSGPSNLYWSTATTDFDPWVEPRNLDVSVDPRVSLDFRASAYPNAQPLPQTWPDYAQRFASAPTSDPPTWLRTIDTPETQPRFRTDSMPEHLESPPRHRGNPASSSATASGSSLAGALGSEALPDSHGAPHMSSSSTFTFTAEPVAAHLECTPTRRTSSGPLRISARTGRRAPSPTSPPHKKT
ncbi:uncharacterized protein TRAVEDRAFT_47560 [Trametes versicolor FP-101664 SS1]|uniref:uncharacterized protein n=1 Tax=Trametes versicolor (strain FP-101664) TaxID=717944 RepID=UPI0004621397|nr:uncharacterized protein TRAVEDRAFT_47560 [Trametes versicolor FP-101664 SS1]EIW58407.1 hypothetical protein TRAVEDRAFT_47560 [Trametes versicolor FP-101664 SS1]